MKRNSHSTGPDRPFRSAEGWDRQDGPEEEAAVSAWEERDDAF